MIALFLLLYNHMFKLTLLKSRLILRSRRPLVEDPFKIKTKLMD